MSDTDYEARLKATGRNDPCVCGSGKKYKKCHLPEDEAAATLKALKEEAKAKAKASKDTDGKVDAKGADESVRPMNPQPKQPGSKGRTSDGRPKNIPRRGAV